MPGTGNIGDLWAMYLFYIGMMDDDHFILCLKAGLVPHLNTHLLSPLLHILLYLRHLSPSQTLAIPQQRLRTRSSDRHTPPRGRRLPALGKPQRPHKPSQLLRAELQNLIIDNDADDSDRSLLAVPVPPSLLLDLASPPTPLLPPQPPPSPLPLRPRTAHCKFILYMAYGIATSSAIST